MSAAFALGSPLPDGCFYAHAGLQAAGFACLTLAAGLGLRTLLAAPAAGRNRQTPILAWNRAGFLCLSAALAAGAAWTWQAWGELLPRTGPSRWGLVAWLVCFTVLHVNRVKGFQGRPAILASLAGWVVTVGAWFALNPWGGR